MLRIPDGLRPRSSIPGARPPPGIDPRLQSTACSTKLKGIKRVAVVGGGFAGLMAARELVRQGVSVSCYEARTQVGGRVFSNRKWAYGRIIEEGAELIGSFHTRWLTLAREFGLAMISRMEAPLYKREGLDVQLILEGERLNATRLTPEVFDKLNTAVEKRVLKPLAKLAEQITFPSEPWLQSTVYWNKAFHTLVSLDSLSVELALTTFFHIPPREVLDPADPLSALFWPMLDFKLVNDEVAPLKDMNFLGLLCKVRAGQGERMFEPKPDVGYPANPGAYWDELEIFRCADGCDALATKLKAAIETPQNKKQLGKVHENEAVTQIHFAKDGSVTLWHKTTTKKNDGKFVDATPARRIDGFSHVIFAIPPSVWSGVRITNDRPGTAPAKDIVYLNKEIGLLHMNGAVKHFSKVEKRFWIKNGAAPYGGASRLGQVWEGTDNQTWVTGQDTVLSVFAGPVSKSNHPPTAADIKEGLGRLFPVKDGNPGYTASLVEPKFCNWPDEAFIKTGYWSPLPKEIFAVSKKLTEPLLNGRLYFAGEHTDTGFFGYMEGALRSGERAANALMLKVCGLLKKVSSEPSRLAEFGDESPWLTGPDDESIDETEARDGNEAVPMWNESEEGSAAEDGQSESFEDEDTPLQGAEVNTESAAPYSDESIDAPAFE
jgi:monoamine oxidase